MLKKKPTGSSLFSMACGESAGGWRPHAVCPVVAQLVCRSPIDLDALGYAKRVSPEEEQGRGKRHAALDNLQRLINGRLEVHPLLPSFGIHLPAIRRSRRRMRVRGTFGRGLSLSTPACLSASFCHPLHPVSLPRFSIRVNPKGAQDSRRVEGGEERCSGN